MLLKCYTQYASKIGKLSSGHRTGKGQFSFQSQRKAMPSNVQTTCTVAFISYTSKVVLKILQARLQQYMNQECPDVQAGFREGRGTRDQVANIHWIIEKAMNSRKTSALLTVPEPLTVWITTNCLKEIGIPDHLTCLLRMHTEAPVRNIHGTTDWFQIGKGLHQGCILSPCSFNLYAEYIMRNTRLGNTGLESRLPGEISITSDMQMTPPLCQRVNRN